MQPDIARIRTEADGSASGGASRLDDFVACEHHRLGATLDVHREPIVRSVIQEAVVFDAVTVAGERLAALGPEQHSEL